MTRRRECRIPGLRRGRQACPEPVEGSGMTKVQDGARRSGQRLVQRRLRHLFEHGLVHVGEALEVEAALANLVLAELREQRGAAQEAAIEGELAGPRREADPA